MKEVKRELNELYLSYLSKVVEDRKYFDYIDKESIDSPLFISPTVERGNYYNSNLKILFVGKENNGWFGKKEREECGVKNIQDKNLYLEKNLDLYERFNLGKNYRKPFFTFIDLLISKFNEKGLSAGFVWSNLLRMDCGGEHNIKTEVFNIDENKILVNEIKILKPDMVIFATGPNYDYWLDKTFIGLSKECMDDKTEREFCILKHPALPEKSVRIYHPDYHLRLGSDYRIELIEKLIELVTD
jgi:hypothetical protein